MFERTGFEEESLIFRRIEENGVEQDRDACEELLIEGMLGKSTGLVFPRAVGETTEANVDISNTLLYWKDEKNL